MDNLQDRVSAAEVVLAKMVRSCVAAKRRANSLRGVELRIAVSRLEEAVAEYERQRLQVATAGLILEVTLTVATCSLEHARMAAVAAVPAGAEVIDSSARGLGGGYHPSTVRMEGKASYAFPAPAAKEPKEPAEPAEVVETAFLAALAALRAAEEQVTQITEEADRLCREAKGRLADKARQARARLRVLQGLTK